MKFSRGNNKTGQAKMNIACRQGQEVYLRGNELLTTPAVKQGNETTIAIPESCRHDFVKAMKIGYFKEFYKKGFITADQLEMLITMQNRGPKNNEVA